MLDLNDRLKHYSTALYEQFQKRLQNGSNGATDLRIGLWGTTGSGKTTYFGRLYQALACSPRWIVERNSAAYDYLEPVLEDLESGNLPLPTRKQDDLKIYEYRLAGQEAFKGVNVTLSFIDAPGEFYENPLQGIKRIEKQMDILDYLGSCHGIIFLLDPDRNPKLKKLGPLLGSLMAEFQKRSQAQHQDKVARRLQQYMAFCVTKVDQAGLWEEAKNPEAQARRMMGSQMYKELKHNFCMEGRYKFYPISAIGRYQNGEEWISVVNNLTSPNSTSTDLQSSNPPQTKSLSSTESPQKVWEIFPPTFEFSDESVPTENQMEPLETELTLNNSDNDNYAEWHRPELQPQPQPVQRSTFDVDKDPVPLNVIAPIEWLIESIRTKPPVLNSPVSTK